MAGAQQQQTNRWQIGGLYEPGGPNGIFTQPGGLGTTVLPSQANSVPWTAWPAAGTMILNEYSPWFAPGCGHSIKFWKLIKEFDYATGSSCCLVCCPICTFVQRVVEPYDEILDPIGNAIIV